MMSHSLFPTLATPPQNHKFYSKKGPSSTVGNTFKARELTHLGRFTHIIACWRKTIELCPNEISGVGYALTNGFVTVEKIIFIHGKQG